jgi:hypothetical protein
MQRPLRGPPDRTTQELPRPHMCTPDTQMIITPLAYHKPLPRSFPKEVRAKRFLDILNLFLGPGPHIDDCFVRDDIDWMQRSQPITFVKDILFEEVVAIRWYIAAIPREHGRKPTGCSRSTSVVVIILQRAQTGKRIAGVIRIRPPTWHLSARPASQTFAGDLLRRLVS